MSSVPEPIVGCRYNALPDIIHELILDAPTADVLNQCFTTLDTIFTGASADQPLLILTDIRQSGVPAPHLLWRFSRALLAKHPNPPKAYNAVMHRQSSMMTAFMVVMTQLARLFGAQVRFFTEDERPQAVAWLKQQAAIVVTPPQ